VRELYRDEVWMRFDAGVRSVVGSPDYDSCLKLLLLGPSGVGKSTFLHRLCEDSFFEPAVISTMGIDFKIRHVALGSTRVKLQLWDTGGSERFQTVISSYYRQTQGAFLMFDVTDRESYDEALRRFEAAISTELPSHTVVVLVGLRAGEAGEEHGGEGARGRTREVSAEEARARASTLRTAGGRRVRYVECSARSGRGVEQAAYALVRPVLSSIQQAGEVRTASSGPQACHQPAAGLVATAAAQLGALALDGRRAAYASTVSASAAGASALVSVARPALRPAAPALIRLARAWDEHFGT